MKNEIFKFIQKHEWKKFLTRPYNLFFVSIHARAYHSDVPKIANFNCQNSLYVSRGSTVDICRCAETIKEIQKSINQLITNKENLKKILDRIKDAEQKIKNIVDKNKNCRPQISPSAAKNYLKLYSKFFASLTAIPFNVGNVIIENKLTCDKKQLSCFLSEFEHFRSVNYYQDFEKCVLNPLFTFLSEKHNLSINDIRYLTVDEIEKLIDGKFNISNQELEGRKKQYIYLVSGQKAHLICDNNLLNKLNQFFYSPSSAEKNIKGQTAYPGRVRGKVKIVLRPADEKNFIERNILVSVSTNPELIPILRKAGAIVTDEGGLLSHAAILARELKIPCIIGTGNATKILKDGDFVEVDAKKGEIKILSQTENLNSATSPS